MEQDVLYWNWWIAILFPPAFILLGRYFALRQEKKLVTLPKRQEAHALHRRLVYSATHGLAEQVSVEREKKWLAQNELYLPKKARVAFGEALDAAQEYGPVAMNAIFARPGDKRRMEKRRKKVLRKLRRFGKVAN